MPTKLRSSNKEFFSSLGIGFVGLGVIWEGLFGPSWPGWAGIAAGLILILLAQKPQFTPLKWPILILILMSGVSLLLTAEFETTSTQVSRLLAGLAGFFGLVNWARNRQQLFLASWVFIGAGLLIALAAPVIVRWNQAKGVPVPNAIYDVFPLLFEDAVHPNVMVSIMILLIPLSLAYLLYARQQVPWPLTAKWGQILLLTALIAMSIVLLLTKSRGGYAAGAIGVLTVLWFSRQRILVMFLTLITISLGAYLVVEGEHQSQTMIGEITSAGTLAFRQQVWRIATWMMSDFPFTGVGMGAFNDVATRLYPFPVVDDPGAHNLALQVGVDLGIPGLIAFLAILILTVYMGLSSIAELNVSGDIPLRALSIGLLAGIIALFFHGLVDITVWGTRVAYIPWLVIGLIAAIYLYLHKRVSRVS